MTISHQQKCTDHSFFSNGNSRRLFLLILKFQFPFFSTQFMITVGNSTVACSSCKTHHIHMLFRIVAKCDHSKNVIVKKWNQWIERFMFFIFSALTENLLPFRIKRFKRKNRDLCTVHTISSFRRISLFIPKSRVMRTTALTAHFQCSFISINAINKFDPLRRLFQVSWSSSE